MNQDTEIKNMENRSTSTSLFSGTIYLMLGQGVFILSGYGAHVYLARVFGPENYGLFGIVISILIWFELAIIRGVPTTVQKFLSKEEDQAYAIKKISLRLQLCFAAFITLILYIFAPAIAEFLKDARLVFFLRLASIDIIIYGIYSVYLGIQNGLGKFEKQSLLTITYSVGKFLAILLLVNWGFSVTGAVIGNILGSCLGLILGFFLTRIEKSSGYYDNVKLIKFTVPIVLVFLGSDLLYNIDLWSVKFFLSDAKTGHYIAAQNIARIPVFLFYALSFTLLPSLSKSINDKNLALTKSYITQATRILLLILTPLTLLVISTSNDLIALLYTDKYQPAADILNILIVGFGFLAFFFTLSSAIIAANKPYWLFGLAATLVLIDVILNVHLVPLLKEAGAAVATTITALLGTIVLGFALLKKFKALVDLGSFFKISAASIVLYFISSLYSLEGGWLILNYIGLGSVYLILLLLFKEIKLQDIQNIKTALKIA
ncbi:MAG: oligosaccharide flippase family protein [Thermodesulfobacteriota bacterium]